MSEGARAWQAVLSATTPIPVDAMVQVRKLPDRSRAGRLVVEVLDSGGGRLGSAAVFRDGWYPGGPPGARFSHYFPVLDRALAGLETRGEDPLVRLQLLEAVNIQHRLGRARPYVVLLRFVVAPEHAIAGSRLEQVYHCPLSGFYRHFLNLGNDVLRDASRPSFVAGQAIHRGYGRAARAYLESADASAARAAYLDGVVETWAELFPYLLLDRPTGGPPTKLYRLPIDAANAVIGRCRQLYDGHDGRPSLLQERLFFSPTRGISGKADRIVEGAGKRELWELKTKLSGWAADRDPRTGRTAPGGVQALAYHEILRSIEGRPPRTFVELLDVDGIEGLPLQEHPVVSRANADVIGCDERYVDLVAQSRNVAFLVESGLLTGYDREKLAALARQGQKLRAVGGDYDLYGTAPPCGFCPAGQRGLCEASRSATAAPWFGFFRHVPDVLFEYWAWFHAQLKQAERLDRARLFRLVTTPARRLEQDEGICVTGLAVVPGPGRSARLRRAGRIETRLRPDDRVLVTRMDQTPGELYSIEGTIREVGAQHLDVDLLEPVPATPLGYRVDQLGYWDRGDWQLEGLTDFLVGSMLGAEARGRRLDVSDLPRLTRVILGLEPPTRRHPEPRPPAEGGGEDSTRHGLNPTQARVIQAALALEPGELLLVQGPPGTGKTTMIANLVRQLVARDFWRDADGRRPVLVLANTHRACNEAVLKLHQRFPDLRPYLVRIGPVRGQMEEEVTSHVLTERLRVAAALQHPDLGHDGPQRLARLVQVGNALHDEALIFVGTLAGAGRPELRGLEFSTVIVDETGQATEPAALQALRHAVRGYRSRMILVGDERQLPPVVQDEVIAPPLPTALAASGFQAGADEPGLRVSLFERLARRHPDAPLTLVDQYRMCRPISDLVSQTFYDGRLQPGDPRVAEHHFDRFLARVGAGRPTAGAAGSIFDPAYAVVLIDTSRDPRARDTPGARWRLAPSSRDDVRDNAREAELIAELLGALLEPLSPDAASAVAGEIGVISAYRKQNTRIIQELRARLSDRADRIRVDTVDRFQGGECELVVISLVASNPAHSIGPLHADWRRLNVAISRARAKLVIVGSRDTFTAPSTLEEEPAKRRYRRLFELVDRQVPAGRALIVRSTALGTSPPPGRGPSPDPDAS